MLRWMGIFGACLGLSTAVAVWSTVPEGREPDEKPIEIGPPTGDVTDYKPITVLDKPIRAIVDAPFVTADKTELADNALIIGVEVNGQSRAYPINQLTGPYREIINDELGGTPIAATW